MGIRELLHSKTWGSLNFKRRHHAHLVLTNSNKKKGFHHTQRVLFSPEKWPKRRRQAHNLELRRLEGEHHMRLKLFVARLRPG